MAAVHSRTRRDWLVLGFPILAIIAARFATHTELAERYPRVFGLLFLWIAADSLTLAMMAKTPGRRPSLRMVAGTLATGCAIVVLGASAPVRGALLAMPAVVIAMLLTGAVYLGWTGWIAAKAYGSTRNLAQAAEAILPKPLIRLAAFEIGMLKLALIGWRAAPSVPAGARAFAGHRIENQMVAAMLALQLIEIGVVHLLISHWSPAAAPILLVLGAWGLLFTIALMNALRCYPALLIGQELRLRSGITTDLVLPLSQVASIEASISDRETRRRDVLRCTILAHPNVVLRLSSPLARTDLFGRDRHIGCIALRIDEPTPFIAAISTRI